MAELIYDNANLSSWCVVGKVDYDSVVPLTEQGCQLLKNSEIKHCTIDFSGLSHFNSALLSLILCWCRCGLSLGVEVVFKSAPVLAHQMAETYGLKFLLEEK